MSLTKRWLDELNDSQAKCEDCVINWDDKFIVLCEKHQEDFPQEEWL